jgi:hypothetical protein
MWHIRRACVRWGFAALLMAGAMLAAAQDGASVARELATRFGLTPAQSREVYRRLDGSTELIEQLSRVGADLKVSHRADHPVCHLQKSYSQKQCARRANAAGSMGSRQIPLRWLNSASAPTENLTVYLPGPSSLSVSTPRTCMTCRKNATVNRPREMRLAIAASLSSTPIAFRRRTRTL